jgi:hypothetical protein
MRRWQIISLLLLLGAALIIAQPYRPPQGCTLARSEWAFNRLKNRTRLPGAADFDERATLTALLQPGDDRARWAETRAAVVEGYVVTVYDGSVEAANCFSSTERDTHIELALRLDAPPRERVILEVTPRLRAWAARQGWDWSTQVLARELIGHWCRFEGWLLFDRYHVREAENIAPGRAENWRATAWEFHPVTRLQVLR